MKFFLFVIAILLIVSCHQKKGLKNNCSYLLTDLLKRNDSTKFTFTKSRTLDWLDVTEIVDSVGGEENLYQFDRNKILRFYAFIVDTTNAYKFSVKYDSLGNFVSKTGRDILTLHLKKNGKDSLDITFFLYGVHYQYRNVNLVIGVDSFKNVEIFKSIFSNLVGHTQTVRNPISIKDSSARKMHIFGTKINMCTHDTTNFYESGFLPNIIKK